VWPARFAAVRRSLLRLRESDRPGTQRPTGGRQEQEPYLVIQDKRLGLMVGRVVLELETPENAKEELSSLSYTGTPVKTAAK